MNHSDIQTYMADYLEGDLPLDRRALFDSHLDACSECAAELVEMRATIAALRGLPEPEVPSMLAANVMRRIRNGESRPAVLERIAGFFERLVPSRLAVPATAAATAFAVLLVTDQIQLPGLGGEGVTPPPQVQVAGSGPVTVRVTVNQQELAENQRLVEGYWAGPSRSGQRFVGSGPWGGHVLPKVFDGSSAPASLGLLDDRSAVTTGWDRQLTPVAATQLASPLNAASSDATPLERSIRVLDERLDAILRAPVRAARSHAALTLAERELWADKLGDRARERGVLDPLLRKLHGTGSPEAISFATSLGASD